MKSWKLNRVIHYAAIFNDNNVKGKIEATLQNYLTSLRHVPRLALTIYSIRTINSRINIFNKILFINRN